MWAGKRELAAGRQNMRYEWLLLYEAVGHYSIAFCLQATAEGAKHGILKTEKTLYYL